MKKKFFVSLVTGICMALSMVASFAGTDSDLREGLLRLHIRANSNDAKDQELKLSVRDTILCEAKRLAPKANTKEEMMCAILSNKDHLEESARQVVRAKGFDYPVDICLETERFPTKVYDDIWVPKGVYDAVVVNIGAGKGDNWWCVVFPPMCFVTEGVVVEDEALRQSLGEETYDIIKDGKPGIRFKLYEMWKEYFG